MEWGHLKITDNKSCSNLEGTYLDKGQSTKAGYTPSLSWYLFNGSADWRRASRVSVRCTNDFSIRIDVLEDNQIIFTKELPKEVYSLKGGWFSLNLSEFTNRDGVLAKEWSEVNLAIVDDHLVLEKKTSTIGMMFIVPAAGSSTTWYRFEKVK